MIDQYIDGEMSDGMPAKRGSDGLLSLSSIRAIVWRQRYVLLVIVGVSLIAALIVTLLMTPVYQASTTIRYNPPSNEVVAGPNLDRYVTPAEVGSEMNTIAAVMRSRSMALRVAADLNLESNPALLGEMATQDAPDGVSEESWLSQRRSVAAAIVSGSITTDVPFDSRIITIVTRSTDPVLASQIANSLVTNYLEMDVENAANTNSYAREYLEEQISEARVRLSEAEQNAIEFARANRLIGNPDGGGESGDSGAGTATTLTGTNLSNVNTAYAEARANRIVAEQRWQAIANLPAGQLPEAQQNPALQTIEARLTDLRAEASQLEQRYQEDYPALRQVRAQIDVLENRRDAISSEIRETLRNNVLIARRQEAALSRELERVANTALAEQDERVQYNLIDRDVAALRNQLSNLLARYNQISSAADFTTSSVSLVDPALVPGAPVAPSLFKNLLAGLVAGIGLALGFALLREFFDDRLRSTEDIERKLSLPVLGRTPISDADQVQTDLGNRFSALSESYASMRATLDYMALRANDKVIQITSGHSGEGKTTTSIALATGFAEIGRRVLLIDVDLRRPQVGKTFTGSNPEVGLVDVFHNRASFENALLESEVNGLDVLPVGRIPDDPVRLLSSGLLIELLSKVRDKYDLIILDSSPVLGLADAPLIARSSDATLMVIEANRAKAGQVRASARRLEESGANLVGAVLTKFRPLDAGEEYNYEYQYYSYGEDKA